MYEQRGGPAGRGAASARTGPGARGAAGRGRPGGGAARPLCQRRGRGLRRRRGVPAGGAGLRHPGVRGRDPLGAPADADGPAAAGRCAAGGTAAAVGHRLHLRCRPGGCRGGALPRGGGTAAGTQQHPWDRILQSHFAARVGHDALPAAPAGGRARGRRRRPLPGGGTGFGQPCAGGGLPGRAGGGRKVSADPGAGGIPGGGAPRGTSVTPAVQHSPAGFAAQQGPRRPGPGAGCQRGAGKPPAGCNPPGGRCRTAVRPAQNQAVSPRPAAPAGAGRRHGRAPGQRAAPPALPAPAGGPPGGVGAAQTGDAAGFRLAGPAGSCQSGS